MSISLPIFSGFRPNSPQLNEYPLSDGFAASVGDSFDLFDFGLLNGQFDLITLPTIGAGSAWDTTQLYTTGVLSLGNDNATAVPEPSSIALWTLIGSATWLRRRHRVAAGSGSNPRTN